MLPDSLIAPAVPADLRPWSAPHPTYAPIDLTPAELRPGAGLDDAVRQGWAEPVTDPTSIDWPERQAAALIGFDVVDGYPLNPAGRTGRVGRDLGYWGENAAADPIVVADTAAGRRVLLIRRDDCGDWAIPGGMVSAGEAAPAALVRELREETGVDLTATTPLVLADTYVDDPRNTDHSWICTTVALFRLPTTVTAVAADDATDARWFPFPSLAELLAAITATGGRLYPAHASLLALAALADA